MTVGPFVAPPPLSVVEPQPHVVKCVSCATPVELDERITVCPNLGCDVTKKTGNNIRCSHCGESERNGDQCAACRLVVFTTKRERHFFV